MADPVRVAIVSHTAALGGAETSMLRLAAGLDRGRFAPVVVLFQDGPLRGALEERGLPLLVVPLPADAVSLSRDAVRPDQVLRARLVVDVAAVAWRLERILRRERVAIVHTHSLKSHLVAGVAGRAAGCAVLWHVREHLDAPSLPGPAATLMRVAGRVLPDAVVAVSGSVARTVAGHRARVVYEGIDLPAPPPAAVVDGPVRIGMIGRLSPIKGQDVFLAAAALLAHSHPEAEFVLAGDAWFGEQDYARRLRRRAELSGLGDRVCFAGHVEDMAGFFGTIDVAVHASVQPEGFGNVIVEAMTAGVPVIASAAGGPLEIVQDGVSGILVPPGSPEELAAAMVRLLDDPTERRRLGAAGRRHALETFTEPRVVAEIEEIYDELLAVRRRRERRRLSGLRFPSVS